MTKKSHKNLGIIITSESISAVEVINEKKGPSVTNYSKVNLQEGIVEDGCIILNPRGFQEAIQKLLLEGIGGPMQPDNVLISIPEEKIFSHQLTIPKDKLRDLDFIKETAKDFIPIELNEAIFDYKVASENQADKTLTLNFVAAQSSIIEPIIEILNEIKLNVVGIDTNVNCLIRSFNNTLNNNEGDSLILNMNMERDLLAINSESNNIYKIILKTDKKEQIENMKALLNLPSIKEVKEMLLKLKKGEGLTEAQKETLKNALKAYFDKISEKISQLTKIASSHEEISLGTIYLTGMFSGLPGIQQLLSEALPEAKIKTKLEFTEIPDEIENETLEGLGLCLKDVINAEKVNFNILPEIKKHELKVAKITPKLRIYSVTMVAVLMILFVNSGISMAKNYLDYRISSQEVIILNEQALNPYITNTARIKQQNQQDQSQILSILDEALPVSQIIEELETYNNDGISLVRVEYSNQSAGSEAKVNIKAKTVSRSETENFVIDLENKGFYSLVVSPLSNLVGKGERFINITLEIDKEYTVLAFENPGLTETEGDLEGIQQEVEGNPFSLLQEIQQENKGRRTPSIPSAVRLRQLAETEEESDESDTDL